LQPGTLLQQGHGCINDRCEDDRIGRTGVIEQRDPPEIGAVRNGLRAVAAVVLQHDAAETRLGNRSA
jgi:hypothetical protein